jgi:hypothetical protein
LNAYAQELNELLPIWDSELLGLKYSTILHGCIYLEWQGLATLATSHGLTQDTFCVIVVAFWDGRLFVPELLRPPYMFLTLGGIMFSGAVVSTCIGKTRTRYGRTVYRAKNPGEFWRIVTVYYIGGILFIVLFWNRAHTP